MMNDYYIGSAHSQIAKCWLLDWGILLGPLTPLLLVQMICCWCRRTVIEQIVCSMHCMGHCDNHGKDLSKFYHTITFIFPTHTMTYWHTVEMICRWCRRTVIEQIVCTSCANLGKDLTKFDHTVTFFAMICWCRRTEIEQIVLLGTLGQSW